MPTKAEWERRIEANPRPVESAPSSSHCSSSEFERLLDAYNHTRQWNAERWERLSSWARESLSDAQQREFFSILANGTKDTHENPTGAQMINTLKHALRDIQERIDSLHTQGWL